MPAQIGYYDTLKSVAGKVFTYLASITLTGTDGKTITCTQDTSLDEAVAMSSKAPKVSPAFTTPSLGVATATSINSAVIKGGTLVSVPASQTKTITVTLSGVEGVAEANFSFYGNNGTGTGVLKLLISGYLGEASYGYTVDEIKRTAPANMTISAMSLGDGLFTFTVLNNDASYAISVRFLLLSFGSISASIA